MVKDEVAILCSYILLIENLILRREDPLIDAVWHSKAWNVFPRRFIEVLMASLLKERDGLIDMVTG